MSESTLVLPLPQSMVIEVVGSDAAKVLNNLTTNDFSQISIGDHCETFVTDLRGWTVAHGFLLKLEDRCVLVGQHVNPASVCSHIDRYIIREDAEVVDLSKSSTVLLLDEVESATVQSLHAENHNRRLAAPITGPRCQLLIGDSSQFDMDKVEEVNACEFEVCRIRNFWPMFGRDILEKCIPQELDRDAKAISFTKGCYLGQETIARLDARGQLQKKLCLLKFTGEGPQVGDTLTKENKEVGRITSIAFDSAEHAHFALAFLKRGNFDTGTTLSSGDCHGVVLAIPT